MISCKPKEHLDISSISNTLQNKIDNQLLVTNKAISSLIKASKYYITDSLQNNNQVKELYTEKNKRFWNDGFKPNNQASAFLHIINTSRAYGIDTSFFEKELLNKVYDSCVKNSLNTSLLAKQELLFSNEFIKFLSISKYGATKRFRYDSAAMKTSLDTLTNQDITLLTNILNKKSIYTIIDTLAPNNLLYLPLQKGLAKFTQKHSISNKRVWVSSMKPDSVTSYNQAKKALITYGYADSSSVKIDSLLFKSIKEFQHQHGLKADGKIGRATAHMMSKTNQERYEYAAVSLEKLRNKTFDSTDFFFVNIPSYTLKGIENNKVKIEHRVVVGRNINRTPTFEAEMQYLILNPYWSIPYSISSEEILPKIKKNPNVINTKGYTIQTMSMKPVDASTIDWSTVNKSNFNYRIVQTRSGGTALGKVKFIFPNNHSVYFHDTPSKHLFKNDVRAYSHGCIRIHEPLKLAEYILLKQDANLTLDSIESLTNSNNQKRYNLKKNIHVDIDYYTSLTDSNNNIQFYRDIYSRDNIYRRIMFAKK